MSGERYIPKQDLPYNVPPAQYLVLSESETNPFATFLSQVPPNNSISHKEEFFEGPEEDDKTCSIDLNWKPGDPSTTTEVEVSSKSGIYTVPLGISATPSVAYEDIGTVIISYPPETHFDPVAFCKVFVREATNSSLGSDNCITEVTKEEGQITLPYRTAIYGELVYYLGVTERISTSNIYSDDERFLDVGGDLGTILCGVADSMAVFPTARDPKIPLLAKAQKIISSIENGVQDFVAESLENPTLRNQRLAKLSIGMVLSGLALMTIPNLVSRSRKTKDVSNLSLTKNEDSSSGNSAIGFDNVSPKLGGKINVNYADVLAGILRQAKKLAGHMLIIDGTKEALNPSFMVDKSDKNITLIQRLKDSGKY